MNSDQAVIEEQKATWAAHVRKAVLQFLKTAVVVDNDPRETPPNYTLGTDAAIDSGLGGDEYALDSGGTPLPSESFQNALDIRKISDSFSEQGMACAFVLPHDSDNDEAKIRARVVRAAKTADILVLDWHLRPRSSSLTLKLLQEIATSDAAENGRMRLICIYTGESLDEHILSQAIEKLSVGNVSFDRIEGTPNFTYCAKSKYSLIVLANKDQARADILPSQLIDLFAMLADGLIPAFALAAIGAVRKNTHHMLTRFGRSLDPAYISNRLITNPPGDVSELMRELLVAECDNAIGLDSVADHFLESDAINSWLDVNDFSSCHYRIAGSNPAKVFELDRVAITGLLSHGINDNGIKISNSNSREFPEMYRGLISHIIAGTVEKSHKSENEFSRLIAFRREAYGESVTMQTGDWLPSLTTGTLLKLKKDDSCKYLFCFTPACDTLRVNSSRPFVFIEGIRKKSPYNMVVLDGDVEVPLFFDKTYPKVVTYSFKPDKKLKRVRAKKHGEQFVFTPEDLPDIQLVWLGDVRYGRAMSEMAALASRWMRVGVLDSEYLRLAGKKSIPFSS